MLCYACVFRGLRFNVEAHRGRHAISLPIEFINLQPGLPMFVVGILITAGSIQAVFLHGNNEFIYSQNI
jgi:hypothetical protein